MRAAPLPLHGLALAAFAALAVCSCGPGEPARPVASEVPDAVDGAAALPGRWRPAPEDAASGPLDAAGRARAEELATLGYLSGSRPPSAGEGVCLLDAARVQPGLDLVVSGHAPEAVLMRNDGTVLHAWRCTAAAAFPGRDGADAPTVQCWRRARLLPDGRLLSAVSLLECLEASEGGKTALRLVRDTLAWTTGDLFHTNTLELVTGPGVGASPLFEPGDVLVSMRNLDRIGLVDLAARRFRWTRTGVFSAQHDPTLLADGRLLLFDNQGLSRLGSGQRSRAIELDPATGDVLWSWSGSDDDPLWSRTCGTAQRLANGNTLVVESDGGRAFEVTREGAVVWRWNSPYRAGERGQFVATLFDLVRLPPDFPLDWLPADAPR